MSPWVPTASRRAIATHAPMAATYALAVLVGRATAPDGTVSLIWPAAGVGALWVFLAARRGLSVAVSAAVLGAVAAVLNAVTGTGFVLGVIFGVGNGVQASVALVALRWLHRHKGPDGWWRLRDVPDVATLGVALVAGGLAALPLGPLALWALRDQPYVPTASVWMFRNLVGVFVVVPLAIRLLDPALSAQSRLRCAWRVRRGEVAAIAALSLVAYPLVYTQTTDLTLSFIPILLSVWAAMRLDTTAVAVHSLFASAAIVGFTLVSEGPFAALKPLDRSLLAQAYVAATVVFTWLIASQRDELAGLLAHVEAQRAQSAAQAEMLGAIIATASDSITVFDSRAVPIMTNAASERMFDGLPRGTAVDDVHIRAHFESVDGESTFEAASMPLKRALAGETVSRTELVFRRGDTDERRMLSLSAAPLPNVVGGGTGAVVIARDVTEERAAQAEVLRARDDYAMLLSAATQQAILLCDAGGTIRLANEGACTVLGLSAAGLLGRALATLHDAADLDAVATELGVAPDAVHAELARTGHAEARRWRMAVPGADVVSMTVTRTPDGGFLCVASDVTAQVENEALLRDSEARFRQAFDTAPVSMFIVSLDQADVGAVIETNTTALEYTGARREQLLGAAFGDLVHPDDAPAITRQILACAEGRRDHLRAEVRFSHVDASAAWGLVSASIVELEREEQGRSRYLLCLVEDVTARKAAEDALVRQALHDDLTDLPNRVLLRDRLEFALQSIVLEPHLSVGVLFCDLDGFKDVNDAYGHGTGDEVLRQVARRFARTIGPHDTVARLGGDEFAVIRPDMIDPRELHDLADRLLESLQEPLVSARGAHHLGVSIGTVSGDRDADVETLLAQADAAMYEAKREGKNRVRAYDAALQARSVRATRLVPELMAAFEHGEFVVFGQPVISLDTGLVCAIETLIRWQSPSRGIVAPAEFLDVLEASALMVPVGTWVLRESCRIAASWPARPDGSFPAVHVNVSGRQLAAGGFTEAVSDALADAGLEPSRLVLELTETHMPQLSLALLSDLAALRDRGVRIALDDLGTGYSSLARLTELPIDVLKIDRAFVHAMGTDDRCDAVVRAVVGMGDAMGVDVVAEGVERPDQARELVRLGCTQAQGYLYSRPRPEADLAGIVATRYDVATGSPQPAPSRARP